MVHFAGLSDAELISKCLKQDSEAWEALVRRYQRLIASITFKYGLTQEDASDIFQSVCVALFQQLPSLKNQDKINSWIITVTVRECWKFRRHLKQTPTDSLDDPDDEQTKELADKSRVPLDESLLTMERQHLIRRAIELLPEPCRQLIQYLFFRDNPIPYAEISQQLGMPVASIGPTRARCLDKLKTSLNKIGFL